MAKKKGRFNPPASANGKMHKGGMAGAGALTRGHTSLLRSHGGEGAHPTHAHMNKMHGTPMAFGPSEGQGGAGPAPPAGIQDCADDHANSMTDGCM
jgi:hypothetical protein